MVRWVCPDCHDDMAPVFRRSHTRLCPLIAAMIRQQLGL